MMRVEFMKCDPDAVTPEKGTEHSAGFDMVFVNSNPTDEKPYIQYGTGIKVAIPKGHVGLLFPRSSISKTNLMLANCVGVIDSDYRGEVFCRFKVIPGNGEPYMHREKGCQLIIMPIPEIELHELDREEFSLLGTERGGGGFGSTGK